MLNYFCPQPNCGAKITYEAVKPTTCPRCHKTFASAFRATAAVADTRAMVSVAIDDEDDRPLGRSIIASPSKSTTVIKSRPNRREPSRLMNPPAATEPVFPDDDADGEDEVLDPREVRRQARALAATIDTSTIKIADQDEGIFKFADMWAEGAAARESAAKAKPASKRKARR